MVTKHRGQQAKGASNAKSAPVGRAKTKGVAAGVQFGPTTPAPGSMLKDHPATGKGRMR